MGDIDRQLTEASERKNDETDQEEDEGHAEGRTELTDGVVQRGGDALLVGGQRLGDRSGRGAHGQPHAGAEQQQPGQQRQVAAVGEGQRTELHRRR